jgi:uncharacterized protein (TIGR04255 family)
LPKLYTKPPITQAICEFQFKSPKDWDWTIPGLVYQQIESDFPVKKQEMAFEIQVMPQSNPVVQQAGSALSKMQFVSASGQAMVQIGPDLLGINALSPYPGWSTFAQLIARQFDVYRKVANPVAFKRIGLRYINQIEFPAEALELTEYFHFYPHLPEGVEQKHGPFAMRVVQMHAEERDSMSLSLANVLVPTGRLGFASDIDYVLLKSSIIELDHGLKWVEEAHQNVEAMFEACISDKTRALFGESK